MCHVVFLMCHVFVWCHEVSCYIVVMWCHGVLSFCHVVMWCYVVMWCHVVMWYVVLQGGDGPATEADRGLQGAARQGEEGKVTHHIHLKGKI